MTQPSPPPPFPPALIMFYRVSPPTPAATKAVARREFFLLSVCSRRLATICRSASETVKLRRSSSPCSAPTFAPSTISVETTGINRLRSFVGTDSKCITQPNCCIRDCSHFGWTHNFEEELDFNVVYQDQQQKGCVKK